ncbi:MAG: redoxin family protein [Prolixibacteraceae bacterium]
MKQFIFILLLIATFNSFAQHPVIQIGESLPEFKAKLECTTSGKSYSIDELKSEHGLLIIFSCNTCPFVVAWEDRYPMINELAKKNGVGFALMNSNEMKRDGDDSKKAMSTHAKEKKYEWPYLVDVNSDFANLMGAQTTPHVFLFDKNNKLVYKGAIDDNYKNADEVEVFYLKDALNSLGANQKIVLQETRNLGCGIKRKAM